MNKLIFLFIYITLVSCGDGEEILGNCVVAPDLDRVCTEEYQPVCAVMVMCIHILVRQKERVTLCGNLAIKM